MASRRVCHARPRSDTWQAGIRHVPERNLDRARFYHTACKRDAGDAVVGNRYNLRVSALCHIDHTGCL